MDIQNLESGCSGKSTHDAVTLSWENVNAYVTIKQQTFCRPKNYEHIAPQQQILKNVFGYVKPGSLLAIIGASGAGKTTLMEVLTSGAGDGSITAVGNIKVNGVNVGDDIKNISAYVRQNNMFMATLTVKEHLMYTALLKMDRGISKQKKRDRVDEVMQELGLWKCKDSMIGDPGRIKGISGGEMKRLAFAAEILNNPSLLLCDEPTSGLDSFMAENVVQTLKAMADMGKTVVCSIHQPASEVFAMFSHVLILSEGRVAFFGTLEDGLLFYKSIGHPCPSNYNPADFYVKKMAVVPGREIKCREDLYMICDHFEESDDAKAILDELRNISETGTRVETVIDKAHGNKRANATWCQQFGVLVARSWNVIVREPMYYRARLFQSIVVALIIGLVYFQLDGGQEDVMNVNGVIFISLIQLTLSNAHIICCNFPLEAPIFFTEYGSGLYRLDIYFISKFLVELPVLVISSVLFSSIAYGMVGLFMSAEAFLALNGINILVSIAASSFGYICSICANSAGVALTISTTLVVPFILLGGFYLNSNSIPVYLIWLQYMSWLKFGNEFLMVLHWGNVDNIACPENGTSRDGRCTFHDGEEVLAYLNFESVNTKVDVIALLAMLVVYRLVAFLALFIRTKMFKR